MTSVREPNCSASWSLSAVSRLTPVSVSRARNLNRTLLAVARVPDAPAGSLLRGEDGPVELAFRIVAAADLDLSGFAICVSDLSVVYRQYIQPFVVSH